MVSHQFGGETEGNFGQIIAIIIIITIIIITIIGIIIIIIIIFNIIIAILKVGHLTDWQRSRRQVWQVGDSRLFHPAMTFHPVSVADRSYLI